MSKCKKIKSVECMEWEIYKNYIKQNMNTRNELKLIEDAQSFTRQAINAFLTMNKKSISNNKTISLSNMKKILDISYTIQSINEIIYSDTITDHQKLFEFINNISTPTLSFVVDDYCVFVSLYDTIDGYNDIKYIAIHTDLSFDDTIKIDEMIENNKYITESFNVDYLINHIRNLGYQFIE